LPNDAEERQVRHDGKRQGLISFPNNNRRTSFQLLRPAPIDAQIHGKIGFGYPDLDY
jgi:hypothetical protein